MNKIQYIIIVIITVIIAGNVNAQDKIFLKSGNSFEAKISEINQKDIKYKKFNNLEGPIFTIGKNEIHMIVYENGENEMFSKKHTSIELKRNRFEASFGFAGYAFNTNSDTESFGSFNRAISYERILNESGLLGLKFKGDVGLTDYDDIIATIGVALNVYPFKDAKWLYVGPSIKYGAAIYDDYYDDSESVSYLGLGLNVGSQFQITSLFGIRAGIEYNIIQIDDLDLGDMGEFQFQLGFNFSF